MPNGNNLMTGRASVEVSGDTRPQYGLPFPQLPGAARTTVTPELRLKREIRMGQKQIQNQFDLQWQEISRSGQFIGQGKTNRMLQQLHAKAKQDISTFNQKAQMQIDQLRDIDRLAEQGMIGNADYLKAYQVYGPQVARSMYPEPEKESETIEKVFGRLDVYGDKLAQDRAQFRIVGEPLPKPPSGWLGLAGPLVTGAVAAHRISKLRKIKEKGRKGELQWWNPNIPVKIPELDRSGKKTGRMLDEMGDWEKVKSGSERAIAYDFILKEEKAIAKRKAELIERFGVGRRIVQPGTTEGGAFNDGIAEAVRGPVTRQPTRQLRQPRQPEVSDPLGLR